MRLSRWEEKGAEAPALRRFTVGLPIVGRRCQSSMLRRCYLLSRGTRLDATAKEKIPVATSVMTGPDGRFR